MKPYIYTTEDLKYQKERDALIPLAEAYADEQFPTERGRKNYLGSWTRIFIARMDELWQNRPKTREKIEVDSSGVIDRA